MSDSHGAHATHKLNDQETVYLTRHPGGKWRISQFIWDDDKLTVTSQGLFLKCGQAFAEKLDLAERDFESEQEAVEFAREYAPTIRPPVSAGTDFSMRFELEPFNRSVQTNSCWRILVAAAETLKAAGKSLTFRSYREVGKYAASTINDGFGSWNDALERAGLDPRELKKLPVDVLFDNLRLVWLQRERKRSFET